MKKFYCMSCHFYVPDAYLDSMNRLVHGTYDFGNAVECGPVVEVKDTKQTPDSNTVEDSEMP